jgi:short-subunit dehydrogenase involved in D-alanine esterification of teichoic acids
MKRSLLDKLEDLEESLNTLENSVSIASRKDAKLSEVQSLLASAHNWITRVLVDESMTRALSKKIIIEP